MLRRAARSPLPALAAILLLALLLRVIRLDFQPLWWDEGYSVFFATRDFLTMLARTAVDIHPPLYYALLQLWIPLVGKSDLTLRLLSVLIGLATVPLLFAVGRSLFGLRTGLLSALLLALSPLHVYYSQEVRMYGLVALLSLGSIALQLKLLEEQGDTPSLPTWIAYVLVTAAALYTQYFTGLLVVAEVVVALFWLFVPGGVHLPSARARRLRPWLFAWAGVLLLYLPWLAYAGPKLYTYVTAKVGIEQYAPLDPLTFLAHHLIAFSAGHLSKWTWLGLGAVVPCGLVVSGLAIQYRKRAGAESENPAHDKRHKTSTSLLVYVFVSLLIGWLVNLRAPFHPFGFERTLLFVLPPFLLLAALGLDAFLKARPRVALSALGLVVVLSAASLLDFYSVPRYENEDYRPLIAEIADMAQPGDTVLAPYPWQIGYLESYYRGNPINIIEVPSEEWIGNPADMDRALELLRRSSPRVWLLAYQTKGRQLEDQIANHFAEDYIVADNWVGNTRAQYWAQLPDPTPTERPIEFAPGTELTSFGIGSGPFPAGAGVIPLRLHWQAKAGGLSYSLRLVDASGETRLQVDAPIIAGNEIERRGWFVPKSVKPGEYNVRLIVYHSADGSPVAAEGRTEFDLARIEVLTAVQ